MFGISENAATLLSLPATFATAFGFIWSFGKMMHAMAESQLLPAVFKRTTVHGVPWVCLLFGSAVGYGICFIVYYNHYVFAHMFGVCVLFAFTAYIAQSVGYVFMQTKLRDTHPDFRSPLGVYGAYISILVWSLIAICVIALSSEDKFELIVYAVVMSLLTVYYHAYANTRQTFSEDERKILFTAHVSNFNKNKSKKKSNRGIAAALGLGRIKSSMMSGFSSSRSKVFGGSSRASSDNNSSSHNFGPSEKDVAPSDKFSESGQLTQKAGYVPKGGWTGDALEIVPEEGAKEPNDEESRRLQQAYERNDSQEHGNTVHNIEANSAKYGPDRPEPGDGDTSAPAPAPGLTVDGTQAPAPPLSMPAAKAAPFIPLTALEALEEDMRSYEVDGVRYESLSQSVRRYRGDWCSRISPPVEGTLRALCRTTAQPRLQPLCAIVTTWSMLLMTVSPLTRL